jgi:hypothetical protein
VRDTDSNEPDLWRARQSLQPPFWRHLLSLLVVLNQLCDVGGAFCYLTVEDRVRRYPRRDETHVGSGNRPPPSRDRPGAVPETETTHPGYSGHCQLGSIIGYFLTHVAG